MPEHKFRVWRGDAQGGQFVEYNVPHEEGMVVLDALHRIQAQNSSDLAIRWNCKAGKCGSCSMEINGKPRLSCMTRINEFKIHGLDPVTAWHAVQPSPIDLEIFHRASYHENEFSNCPAYQHCLMQQRCHLRP